MAITCENHNNATQNGLALVSLLWVIALLSIMAAAFSISMRRDGALVHNAIDSARARYLAEAGVYYAAAALWLPNEAGPWSADGAIHPFQLDDGQVRVAVWDEAGRIDLNNAPDSLLDGALRVAGLDDPDERATLLDRIRDWTDPDDLRRLRGAEAADYQAAGLSYKPRNGAFQSVQELSLVLGMTNALFRRLQPLLTVYSGLPGIDPTAAPRPVLLALPGVDSTQVDRYMATREDRLRGSMLTMLDRAGSLLLPDSGGEVVRVLVQARLANGVEARVRATLVLSQRDGSMPFTIVGWTENRKGSFDLFATKETPGDLGVLSE
jgi:general secretion pathway protein K